jgi:hypothetical protein
MNYFLQKQKHFAQRSREHKENKAVIYFESLRLRASSIIFSQLLTWPLWPRQPKEEDHGFCSHLDCRAR